MKTGLLFLITLSLVSVGCTRMRYAHGIPNLVQVAPSVWRGGQPTDEGWKYLKENLGVTNVIKLNLGEDQGAKLNGMEVTQIPMSLWQMIFGPTRSQIQHAVGSIKGGTYVHCRHGQDRTGLVIGEYRGQVNGWQRTKAYKEMLDNDFHRTAIGLWWFWNAGGVNGQTQQ